MRTITSITIMRSLMLILALALTACANPGAGAAPPAVSPTVAQAYTASPSRMEFHGIGFSYDPALAERVTSRLVSGEEYMGTRLPDYIEFAFDDNPMAGIVARQAGIRVFRVRDLEQINSAYKTAVAAFEPMPLINATRTGQAAFVPERQGPARHRPLRAGPWAADQRGALL
jgi:hypothetical protein